MRSLLFALVPLAGVPGPLLPRDPGTYRIIAHEPISRSTFDAAETFVVSVYGIAAPRLFQYFGPNQWQFQINGIRCDSARATFGLLERACQLTFHPSKGDLAIHAGEHTFVLHPEFQDDKLQKITIVDMWDDVNLLDRSCFHFKQRSAFIRKLECSYQHEGTFGPVRFPDAENPQGIAVGWGVFTPEGQQLR